jgi:hypothetical protein
VIRRTGFLLFGLAGALLLSQFPEFFQQYTQRLGGRLDEVTAQAIALEGRAAEAGKDLASYLERFLTDPDPNIRREGRVLAALPVRRAELQQAYLALTGVGRGWRAKTFVQHFDWKIVRTTAAVYQPATPLTAESGVYAGAGFGAGAMAFWLFFGIRRKRRKTDKRPS